VEDHGCAKSSLRKGLGRSRENFGKMGDFRRKDSAETKDPGENFQILSKGAAYHTASYRKTEEGSPRRNRRREGRGVAVARVSL